MRPVLAFTRFYLPGYRAGGPIVSLSNLFRALGEEIDFRLVTTDRDLGDDTAYRDITAGTWTNSGQAKVLYLPTRHLSQARISTIVKAVRPRIVYLNSFFDTWFTTRILLARRFGRIDATRVILAPRGEFSLGAMSLKRGRKLAYMTTLERLGALREIDWHASTPLEAEQIVAALGPHVASRVLVAPDLGALPAANLEPKWSPRPYGEPLRICFLSRVSPMKNLLGAIRSLGAMTAPATLTVYGPKEDAAYWCECQSAASLLPAHVRMIDGGILKRDEVHTTIEAHDVFFLPTLGENYGHVIPEALSVGLPAVISDQTPWKNLHEEGVGYDGPLDAAAFARELDRIADLDPDTLGAIRSRCRQYARAVLTDPEAIEANRRLLAD